jgi:hypothetical protein
MRDQQYFTSALGSRVPLNQGEDGTGSFATLFQKYRETKKFNHFKKLETRFTLPNKIYMALKPLPFTFINGPKNGRIGLLY